MKYILGKKLGMTRHISETGEVVPVTIIEAGPCVVTQIKEFTEDKKTFQLGFGDTLNLNKPQAGHLKENKLKHLKEFKFDSENQEVYELNKKIDLSIFAKELPVKVTGVSKGKGFQGTVKRHNFSIGPMTHGSRHHRKPGSIGSMYPQKVLKGRQMPGRMGNDKKTILNLKIVDIEADKNLLLVKGSVPGQNGKLLIIRQK